MTLEEHPTSDGALTLIVDIDGSSLTPDYSVGFDGFEWHTHGDLLYLGEALPQEAAVRKFVDQLLNDQLTIVVSRINGKITNAWVTDELNVEEEIKYKPDEETLEFRYWSGSSAIPV